MQKWKPILPHAAPGLRDRRKDGALMNEYMEMILVASPLLVIAAAVAFAAYWITRKK
ncbi:hypothetical protein [Halomonas heilongjiangensis]|uniref:hypothetical protein n=1 Tax=Halomonas heilongjiangensis TaxID=1387883 RepID=UPI0014729B12|nr:hypothetical protein [Halomonas heilongjiangensis]